MTSFAFLDKPSARRGSTATNDPLMKMFLDAQGEINMLRLPIFVLGILLLGFPDRNTKNPTYLEMFLTLATMELGTISIHSKVRSTLELLFDHKRTSRFILWIFLLQFAVETATQMQM